MGSPQEVASFKKIILYTIFIPLLKYNIRCNFINMMPYVKTFQIFITIHSLFIQWVPNVPSGVLIDEICAVVMQSVGCIRPLVHLPYPKNLLPWTYLKLEWSLSAILLSIVSIPLLNNMFWAQYEVMIIWRGKSNILFMATSRDEHVGWYPSPFYEDLRR